MSMWCAEHVPSSLQTNSHDTGTKEKSESPSPCWQHLYNSGLKFQVWTNISVYKRIH